MFLKQSVSKIVFLTARRQPTGRLASIAALLSRAGCVKAPVEEPPVSPAFSGIWVGEIQWHASFPADDGKTSGAKEIGFVNCDVGPEFYWKEGDGYIKGNVKWQYLHNRTTHLFFVVTQEKSDDPSWIEAQSWTLVELPPDEIAFSWSRSVDNRHSTPDDPERTFSQVGFGRLTRTSEGCEDLE
jgi:hypothetical protein